MHLVKAFDERRLFIVLASSASTADNSKLRNTPFKTKSETRQNSHILNKRHCGDFTLT